MEADKFYENYTIEDYILDERFHDWVRQGRDEKFWQGLISDNPSQGEKITAARDFILNLRLKEHLPHELQEKEALAGFIQKMGDGHSASQVIVKKGGLRWMRRAAASLLVFCVVGGGTWLLLVKKKPVLVRTDYGQMKQIMLPDKSVIYLNANSSLRYENSLLGKFPREVWLEGEAFFRVEKEKNSSGGYRNFIVHTDGMGIEVLGTSFNVRERRSVSSVTLQSGKVRVSLDEGEKVTLNPGERIEFNRQVKKLVKNKVEPERYTSWRNLRYTFDQTPVSELVQMISDNYGLKVVIKDEKIAGSKLSGVLEANNLQTFVNALSFALNIKISKEGNQLIFEPKQR